MLKLIPAPPGGLSGGAIVGIVFGVLGGVALLAVGALFLIRYKNIHVPFLGYGQFDNDDETNGQGLDNPMYDVPTDVGDGEGGQYGSSGGTNPFTSPLD